MNTLNLLAVACLAAATNVTCNYGCALLKMKERDEKQKCKL